MAYRRRKSTRRPTRAGSTRRRTARRSRSTAGRRRAPMQTVKIVVEGSGASMPDQVSVSRSPISASVLQSAKKSRF